MLITSNIGFSRVCSAVGLKGFLFHDLRHTFATLFLEQFPDQLETLKDLRGRSGHEAGVWRLPKGDDYYGWRLANEVLGAGASGRLYLNLRQEKGYSYGISSSRQISWNSWKPRSKPLRPPIFSMSRV